MKVALILLSLLSVASIVFVGAVFLMYPMRYKDDITYAAEVFGVDAVLIISVIKAESNFDPNAVSAKGAIGLMQVIPSTAAYVSERINITIDDNALYDTRTNIIIGTYYLKYLLDKFGDLKTALIAYNAGEGNVTAWLGNTKYASRIGEKTILTNCPYPSTNAYVNKVLRTQKFYKFRLKRDN